MKHRDRDEQLFHQDYEKIRRIPADSGSEEPARTDKRSSRARRGSLRFAAADPSSGKRPSRSRGKAPSPAPRLLALCLALAIGAAAGLGGGYWLWGADRPSETDLKAIEAPSWIQQDLIRKNIYSRPDVTLKEVRDIVIHYVANPGSSAKKNRNYFDSLADQDPQGSGTSASSHFVVGLQGEILQCIPISEVAYANAPRNLDTISIEVCHPDETGKFNEATYDSLVKLTAWLCKELDLSVNHVIRHYDVNEKACPLYYVEHEDAWKQFKKDVKKQLR